MTAEPPSLFSYFRRRRARVGCRFIAPLWSEVYRGVQIGNKWIGWTNPEWKERGW